MNNNNELTIAILTYNTEYNSFQNNRIKNTGKFFKIGKANEKEQINIYDTFMKFIFLPWFNTQKISYLKLTDYDFIFENKFNFYSLKKSLNNQEEYKKIVNLLIGFFENKTKIKDQWKKFIKNYEYQELKIYKENQQNQQNLNQIFYNSKSGYVELAYYFPVIFRYFLLNYVIPSYIVQNAGANSNNISERQNIINQYPSQNEQQPQEKINKKLNNEFPDLDLKGSTFLQKFISDVIEKNNNQNPDIFVVYLQESNMSAGYSDRLIQSLFHELNYDTFTILNSKEIFNMYRSRDSRLASKVKTITKGRIGTGYEKGQRIGIFIKQNITLENLDLSKNKYPSCDDSQGLQLNKIQDNKIIYKRTKKDELNQKILFSCTHDPLQYKSGLVGEHKSKSIISAFFIAKKEDISYPIFLLNIHLPMEKKSENYGNSIRNKVFENILKYFELNYSAITFIGGDFNYRLKPLGGFNKNGKPMPNPEFFESKDEEYSKLQKNNYHNKNTAFYASKFRSKIKNIYPFTESFYPNPTCAMKHHQHINFYDNRKLYKTSRQPGFCDRIIYRELNYGEVKANPQLNNEIGHYYYVSNTAYWTPDYHQFWFSDHSPVAGIFKIQEINQDRYKNFYKKNFELKNPVYESPIPPQITINDETIKTENFKIKYNITTCHITNDDELRYFEKNLNKYMKKLLDKIYKINCNYYPEIIIFNIPNESFRNIFFNIISFSDYNKNMNDKSIIYYHTNINQESLKQIFESELSNKIECGFSYEYNIIDINDIDKNYNKSFMLKLKINDFKEDLIDAYFANCKSNQINECYYYEYIKQIKRDFDSNKCIQNNYIISYLIKNISITVFKNNIYNISINEFDNILSQLQINQNNLSFYAQQLNSKFVVLFFLKGIILSQPESNILIFNNNNSIFSIFTKQSTFLHSNITSNINNIKSVPKNNFLINIVFENVFLNEISYNEKYNNWDSYINNINSEGDVYIFFDKI